MSAVADLPGYHIDDDDMVRRFRADCRRLATPDDLDAFLDKWRLVWRLGDANYMNDTIVAGCFDKDEALRCIRTSFGGGCAHHERAACLGMMIALPPAFLRATLLAHEYGVPFCTALHQLYCTGDDHEGCF
jgi:hypothetical protein